MKHQHCEFMSNELDNSTSKPSIDQLYKNASSLYEKSHWHGQRQTLSCSTARAIRIPINLKVGLDQH